MQGGANILLKDENDMKENDKILEMSKKVKVK